MAQSCRLHLPGLILGVGIYVGVIFMTAPEVDTNNIYSMLNQRSVMYDADGNEIDNLYFSDGNNRTIVDYEDMPEDLVNAVVSIEDNNFWSHNGFNFIRMIGAVRDSIFGGGQISGTKHHNPAAGTKRISVGDKRAEEPQPKDIRGLLYHRTGKETSQKKR